MAVRHAATCPKPPSYASPTHSTTTSTPYPTTTPSPSTPNPIYTSPKNLTMSDRGADTMKGAGRRAKVFLSPSKKYDIYVQLMRGEITVGAAAVQAGMDRSSVMRSRRSPGSALWRRWPFHGQESRVGPLVTSNLTRPRPGLTGSRAWWPSRRSGWWCWKKRGLGLMLDKPVPAGVDAATKRGLLDLADYTAGQGWPVSKTCEIPGLSERRQRRFRSRQDRVVGRSWTIVGPSLAGRTDAQRDLWRIVKVFETFVDRDFALSAPSSPWLLRAGCLWVSASTVRPTPTKPDTNAA